ncbi:phosphoglucosamine mutase [Andreprevotia lacus DSM 23236]|jgi:phosphoglucosamine mutase|uniref:Phosphoglucosamine mutase n=1 Tax=Andreprevotia lacus DSM 23236 TaxID=1121001 RepID=A0A1W1X063_9NEIS|nr:phosphoglucosamine mutase [Andreprevotia lacus]SMC17088.1 phosphoglucosamine mutase [Andreprevotia lacus DSM 23236]
MARKYFGTDGVRGLVGEYPITPDFAMKLGYAAGRVLAAAEKREHGEHAAVLVGKDTRVSGYLLEAALQAGFNAAGVDVLLTGPLPTPGVAYLTRAFRLSAGVVISASHNPYYDNGIKFFGAGGKKLPDDVELAIEAAIDELQPCVGSKQLGKARRVNDAAGRYIEFCKSTFPNDFDLRGLKLVIDCAHGATYQVAPHVFHELGAEVITIGDKPNGFNINEEVGATHVDTIRKKVLAEGADYGIALDGDGDRLIMVDRDGTVIDGDMLLYVVARYRNERGTLGGGVIGTLMTNLGVENALKARGIAFMRAKVGDRYVMEKLEENGWLIGGEGSGHLLSLDRHSTGDGIISALQVLEAVIEQGKSLSTLCSELTLSTQVLKNVRIAKGFDCHASPAIKAKVAEAEAAMGNNGRVLLRPSGTEPVVRVMVEHSDTAIATEWGEAIAQVVTAEASSD